MNQRIHWQTGIAAILLLTAPACGGASAAPKNPFFAMDTALRDDKVKNADDQAGLLKELGYAGIGASGYLSEEFMSAFDRRGLTVFNTYLTLDFDSAKPGFDPRLVECVARLKGRNMALWLAVGNVTKDGAKLKPSDPAGDEVVAPRLQELAALAEASGIKIALYPHTWFWVERVEDALRLARKVDRVNVGATFNLCHWLKVEGDRDPKPVLEAAMPHLCFVSVNGADKGDTRAMEWDRLIQPLGRGTYDVALLLRTLEELGYTGPVGFQGYGIRGDSRRILTQTMDAWRQFSGVPRSNPQGPRKPKHSCDPAEGFYSDYPQAWRQILDSQCRRAKEGKAPLVFLGDSLVQGWSEQPRWKEHYAKLGAVNFGVGGDGTPQLLYRLEQGILDEMDPKAVMLSVGVNNVWPGFDAEDTIKGIKAVVAVIQARAPQAKILLVSNWHFFDKGDGGSRRRVDTINAALKALADGDKIRVLEVSERLLLADRELDLRFYDGDKLHLSAQGYRLWAEAMDPVLIDIMK